ncbi:hypothetical protein AMR42_13570 [Limnothrix sp. PR1529]|nr:hypothetical protein BCR12_08725 [Limnothrix sp. P13C2]PIB08502.1 hypothetical protein AMR42_13570 [Limnothrix sp. PR1529]
MLVEITSQVVLNQSDRPWNQALHQAIDRLQKLDSDQRTPYAETLSLYQNLVRNRPAKLYELSVRAFSEHPADTLHLLTAWTDTALSGDRPAIKLYEAHDPRFAEHLRTFADRQPMPPQPWSEPQREIGQLTFDEAIRPPKKGLLDRYSDGSLSGPQPKLSDEFKQILPNRPPSALAKSSGVSGSLLSTFRNSNTPPAAIVADLRPLSNHLPIEIAERFITPCVELVNHYRNLQQAEANQPFSQTYTLESLIQSYSHLINDDQYIVGTDANGQPVTSEFKTSPHRFVAGEAGAGKTNFLKVLLYQLLWHNPNRTIWLADFKGGMDFQVVSAVFPNIKLITNYADFDRLLQNFWQQSEERSNDRSENIQEELAYLLQLTPEDRRRYQEEKSQKNHTVSWERNLLIIDEMAQLAHLYDDRDQKEIAKSVKANIDKVVRLGRAFKANIVFCTQSKEENVIDSNLLNNVSDRLVFRVSADTVSLRFLGSDHASKISPRTKGRGIYRGPDYAGDADDLKEIATPRFPDDDQITELNLWEELKNRSIESSEP